MRIPLSTLAGLVAFLIGPCALAQDSFDSDNDGFDDNSDNCTLIFNPAQRDTDGDGFGNFCDPDFNNDYQISAEDLGVLKIHFFSSNPDTDLDGDGVVNIVDLGILKSKFLGSPGPTGTHPSIANCNCRFSADCPSGNFCNYGPGSFLTEDICFWRTPTPNGVPGTACSTEYEGPWAPAGICDGYCTTSFQGSSIGIEQAEVVIAGVGLWAEALLGGASVTGGGPVDAWVAQAAQDLDYAGNNAALELGFHVADLLSIATSLPFYDYFHQYESYSSELDKFVDIENDNCRINSARLSINALQAEISHSGSGNNYILGIADHCEPKILQSLFAPRCPPGSDALECFSAVVADMAVFLSTPPQVTTDSPKTLWDTLSSAR